MKLPGILEDYRSGGRDLEVCVGFGMGLLLKVGDVLAISYPSLSSGKPIERRVIAVRKYANFVKMLEHERPERIYPGLDRKQVLDKLCCRYSQPSRVRGILVFELAPLSKE